MPRTIEIQVYKFTELSDKAKVVARDWYRSNNPFAWGGEYRLSIAYFADEFGISVDWEFDSYGNPRFSWDQENGHFRGLKLKAFKRDYKPTGFCADVALWQTFYDNWKAYGCPKRAFNEALEAFFDEWKRDVEWADSDEAVEEALDYVEYEFNEDGHPV